MASQKPCSPPTNRARRVPAASNSGVLPLDLLFDVLLRLPAKDLCRLRAVCLSWRSLTADPLFIRAHAARHPDPLLLANVRNDQTHIIVMDLSGNVVKRIRNAHGHQLLCTRLDLACTACVATERNMCHVLNPTTGSVYVLPETPAVEHANLENLRRPCTSFAFGRIADTGDYKVLRIFNRLDLTGFNQQQLFEVFTIDGGSNDAQWRARQSHRHFVGANSATVVDGVVYFKMDSVYNDMINAGVNVGHIDPDCIFAFDLEGEEWRADLQGPISGVILTDQYEDSEDYRSLWSQLTLAGLRGSLVLVHYRYHQAIMDLWFVKDIERCLWVKEYSIQTELIFPVTEWYVKALLVLDDGRLVIHLAFTGLLLIYDPITNTFTELEMGYLDAVGMYTGNLMSSQVGDMV